MPLASDPLAEVRRALTAGATIETLADTSQVSRETIYRWLRYGVPSAVVYWNFEPIPTQVEAYRRLINAAIAWNSGI